MSCEKHTRIEQLYGPQRDKNVSSNIFTQKRLKSAYITAH